MYRCGTTILEKASEWQTVIVTFAVSKCKPLFLCPKINPKEETTMSEHAKVASKLYCDYEVKKAKAPPKTYAVKNTSQKPKRI